MSFFRYYRERQDADGEPLFWPGGPEGFPFRGQQPPQTRQEEYEDLKPTGKLKCRVFYLNNEVDLRDYTIIRDKCANGLFIPVDRDRVWDEEKKNYRIFLEWLEMGYELPPKESTDAIRDYTRKSESMVIPIGRAEPGSPYGRLAGVQGQGGIW